MVCWRGKAVRRPEAEQAEAVIEPRGDLLEAHHAQPGSGKFQCQWNAIQSTAELNNHGSVSIC